MGAVGKIKYLKSANSNWNMQSREMLRRLGLKPSSPIPKDFHGKFNVDGVEVIVTLPPVKGARKHRVLAKCPDCGTTLPAGRLHQHTGTKVCESLAADKQDIDNALDSLGMGQPLKTEAIKPQVGDCFYNETLETTGRISKVYISRFTGSEVIDVKYPGTFYEVEIYRTDKIYHHKGDKIADECFRCVKGYPGE